MKKVLLYSLLLVAGLIVSQFLHGEGSLLIRALTMTALAFIMIHVGLEFDIDKSNPRAYGWDYVVAFTAATFPWIFVAAYFVFVMAPSELWGHIDQWKEALLQGRFAAPTSAGVLFAMLAAAGLATTWVFKKARILAIFDDLDTVLLMIPLKMMMVGSRWQLWLIVAFVVVLLVLAWKYMHRLRLPITWPFILLYSVVIVVISELLYMGSKAIDPAVPVHLEVLLPAFVLGVALFKPADLHDVLESPKEKRAATTISALFMILVGLSMPAIAGQQGPASDVGLYPAATETVVEDHPPVLTFDGVDPAVLEAKQAFPGWGMIALHVLAVTALSNIGKMFPAFCYRREAHWRERLAVAIGMWPRGEVGAGVLVVSMGYGIGGPALTVAVLSLALNLLLTGVFIAIVKKLINFKDIQQDESDDSPKLAHAH